MQQEGNPRRKQLDTSRSARIQTKRIGTLWHRFITSRCKADDGFSKDPQDFLIHRKLLST
jgi:hypothetical protein